MATRQRCADIGHGINHDVRGSRRRSICTLTTPGLLCADRIRTTRSPSSIRRPRVGSGRVEQPPGQSTPPRRRRCGRSTASTG
jgi:hypothetical protein